MVLDVREMDHRQVNEELRRAGEEVEITGCCGQRFIAAGFGGKRIRISGVPGNALGAYLNGAAITVNANAQDAVGDTMNEGSIVIHGSIGDAAGYAMRGGEIYVRDDAGYRAGIHMKAYKDKRPVIVIGGKCGSFLGEYQAGGILIVLGLTGGEKPVVGNFPCTGMHGGAVYLRGHAENLRFPPYVTASRATAADMDEIGIYLERFAAHFGADAKALAAEPFTKIVPDTKNPYKQMYVAN